MRLSPIACSWYGSVRYIYNSGYCHRLFFTTCHCLSSTIYLSLPCACPRWKEWASSRTIRWKERASSWSRKHVFHPDEFLRSRVVGQSTSACGFRFCHQRTHTHTHTHTQTQPIVSIWWYYMILLFTSVARTTEGACLWRAWWYGWPATRRKPLTCSSRSESKIPCYMYICTSLEPRLSSSFLSLTVRKVE